MRRERPRSTEDGASMVMWGCAATSPTTSALSKHSMKIKPRALTTHLLLCPATPTWTQLPWPSSGQSMQGLLVSFMPRFPPCRPRMQVGVSFPDGPVTHAQSFRLPLPCKATTFPVLPVPPAWACGFSAFVRLILFRSQRRPRGASEAEGRSDFTVDGAT
jgi:hypothetical protein